MFELGREIRRLFKVDSVFAPHRDGLAGGDPGLLELLSADLVRGEAKAADIAAGRISVKDRPSAHLRQAGVWRELARRTGDATALRKAASAAEAALKGLDRRARPEVWARARVEQAICAMLGIELFADEGLAAAAGRALDDAAQTAPKSAVAAVGQILRAQITATQALIRGDAAVALRCAADCGPALALLDRDVKERPTRRVAALARLARAEILAACGMAMHDERILDNALTDAVRAGLGLDPAYEPVTWSRTAILRAEILTALGETAGDATPMTRAIELLSTVFDHLLRDHSPMDWALGQLRLARALSSLAQATGKADAMEKARCAYDRALIVYNKEPGLALRAVAAQGRGAAIAGQAEMTDDVMALDAAEAAFRCELADSQPAKDPVAWAVCQVSLAQIYLSRLSMTGRDKGERVKAAVALDMALEVFGEHGLRSLSAVAQANLERLKATV